MFRIFKYLSAKFKWLTAIAVVFTVLQVAAFLVVPNFIGQLVGLIVEKTQPNYAAFANTQRVITILRIDLVFKNANDAIIKILIYFISFLLIGTIAGFISSYFSSYISNAGAKDVRNRLWRHLGTLSQKDIDTFTHARIITCFTIDISRIQVGIASFIRTMIIGPSYLALGLIFGLLTDLNLSLVFSVMIPLLSATMMISGIIIGPLFKKEQKAYDEINNQSRENVMGSKFIKSYNLEEIQLKKFDTANNNWHNVAKKSWFSFNLTFNFINLITNISSISIFFVVGLTSRNINDTILFQKAISNGTTFTNYVMFITIGVVMSSFVAFTMARASVSTKRISEILDKKGDIEFIKSDKKITNGVLEFDHVTFRYHESSERNVLEDISFTLKPGQTLGIIGPTGSGKSTIAKLASLDFKTSHGFIKIDGNNITEIDTLSLRNAISHVYQKPALLSGTIKSNLLLANPEASEQDIIDAAKASCAFEYINRFKNKFEHRLEQKANNLSGGQKQRLSIAQGLIRNPKIFNF
ncbi:ABC transporter ATP-binding protein [Mycoplasma struthionis]|uniref:ABC transporter ATP-binding protein n=1 Tax=Mycoplasma struthionis TaxID=538220 RepID=UPI0021BDB326|nr:ABC transporter ATP-binding protein [Mycoplasma struthionis]